MTTETMRYPIGRFKPPSAMTDDLRIKLIKEIEDYPSKLRTVVTPLSDKQLETPYREGGWTIRQLVHHISDSHTSSYIRFKWALTEECPRIKAYNEKDWARLPDTMKAPIDISLDILQSIHRRWVWIMKTMTPDQWRRCFIHPETEAKVSLDHNLALYAWHGQHHLTHITRCIEHQ